ncbi:Aspartic proteinase CDR1 [Linum perenne]
MSPYVHLSILTLVISTSHGFNITIPLIHRDSVYSPFYNANETIAERAQRAAQASYARHQYLSSRDDDVRPQTKLVPGMYNNMFFVYFTIGDPPVPQLTLLDTGSDFLWVRCKPCSDCVHSPNDPPIYDPSFSRTNHELPCSYSCDKCTGIKGSFFRKRCQFTMPYVDGSVSEGIYVTDLLTFQTSNYYNFTTTITNVLFGCNMDTTAPGRDLDYRFSGIMGLGLHAPAKLLLGYPSLVNLLGAKFSYCIGRLSDPSYPYNHISFGGKANLIGRSTPIFGGDYFIHIVSMSLGDQTLTDIKPKVFRNMSKGYGIIVDSGTKLTYLAAGVLDVVNREVRMEQLENSATLSDLQGLQVCYKGTVKKEASGFPSLGFHFQDGAQLLVGSVGLFIQLRPDVFCLAINGTGRTEDISIIGMMAQQGYNVGFDVQGNRIYFQSIGCGALSG